MPTGRSAGPSWSAAPVQRVYSDNAGEIQDSLRIVIRDDQQLRSLWERATARQASPPPLPEVDFGREMLLVVAAGRRGPEDRIRVDSVGFQRDPTARPQTQPAEMTAIVRLSEGCRRFAVDAYPVEIVRVPRFAGPVNWIERRERPTDCPSR
jgi:hypothetical protein